MSVAGPAEALSALVHEAQVTGALAGLPDKHLIAGAAHASVNGAQMETFDPGTGRAFARFAAGGPDDVDRAVTAAQAALRGPWRDTPPAQRGRILHRVAQLIRANADRLAVVECLDSGKRLVEAQGDVAGAAGCFEYYAGACDKNEGSSIPLGAGAGAGR